MPMSSAPLGEELVEPVLLDVAQRRRPALLDLLLLVHVGGGRQGDARGVAPRRGERVAGEEARGAVGLGDELAVHVAGADAQHQHHRRVARLREGEAVLDRGDHRRQVRPRIEQPDLRLHGEGVAALLHDRGALAVVLADDHQRAAGDAARGEVGERVGGDVDADRPLEGDRAAQRVVDRGRERRRGGGLAGRILEADAVLGKDVLGVGEHVHQVRDRRALVAGDVRHARLEQRLGDGQDALAAEHLARAQAQLLDFLDERSLGHVFPASGTRCSHEPAGPPQGRIPEGRARRYPEYREAYIRGRPHRRAHARTHAEEDFVKDELGLSARGLARGDHPGARPDRLAAADRRHLRPGPGLPADRLRLLRLRPLGLHLLAARQRGRCSPRPSCPTCGRRFEACCARLGLDRAAGGLPDAGRGHAQRLRHALSRPQLRGAALGHRRRDGGAAGRRRLLLRPRARPHPPPPPHRQPAARAGALAAAARRRLRAGQGIHLRPARPGLLRIAGGGGAGPGGAGGGRTPLAPGRPAGVRRPGGADAAASGCRSTS